MFVLTELEKQMKIENLFVTWQQRSAQSNMPISVSLTRFQELSKDVIKPQNDVNSKELFININIYNCCVAKPICPTDRNPFSCHQQQG